jgi:hypothetical protein
MGMKIGDALYSDICYKMYMVQEFVTPMRKRGIRLEAMDAQMQAMLQDVTQEEVLILPAGVNPI